LNQMKDGKLVTLQGEFRIWPLPEGKYGDDESLQSILDREIREETEQLNLRRTGERPEN
jgi:ADP-ribose pyrophosphatase YjhB (NUDIX family)